MEEKVRGRARGEFRIQNNMLVEEKEPIIDQKDPFLIGLDKEMDGEDPLDINQVAKTLFSFLRNRLWFNPDS